jgi:hypothetical protein
MFGPGPHSTAPMVPYVGRFHGAGVERAGIPCTEAEGGRQPSRLAAERMMWWADGTSPVGYEGSLSSNGVVSS